MTSKSCNLNFEFIDLAKSSHASLRRTCVALMLILLSWMAGSFIVGFLIGFGQLVTRRDWSSLHVAALHLIVDTVVMWVGMKFVFKRVERRSLVTLISIDKTLKFGRILAGAALWFAVLMAMIVSYACIVRIYAGVWPNVDAYFRWPRIEESLLLMLIVATIPFSAMLEEMIMRGWFTQKIGQFVRNRLAISLIVGVIFSSVHAFSSWPISVGLVVMSLGLSALSLLDGRLEMAIGAHAMNNVWVMIWFVLLPPWQPRTLAFWNQGAGWLDVIFNGGIYLLMFLALYCWRRRGSCQREPS